MSQILAVIARDNACNALALHGSERILIAILCILHAYKAGDKAMKVGQCMLWPCKILAAISVPSLHNQRGYLGCLFGFSGFNLVLHAHKVTHFR